MINMRSSNVIFISVLVLTLLSSAFGGFAEVKGQSYGYAQYKVALNGIENSTLAASAVVNETVQPTNKAGFIDLTLAASFDSSSLSYSKIVNSSSLPEFFPYLPAVTNQSLSYTFRGYSVTAKLDNVGQVPVTFNGTVYIGTKYLVFFSVDDSSKANSVTGNGNITCLPSDLMDSVQLSLNQTGTVNATLLSTDLPLVAASTGVNPVGISLFGVLLVAAVAIAVLAIYRKVRQNKGTNQTEEDESRQENAEKKVGDEDKPPYWVD